MAAKSQAKKTAARAKEIKKPQKAVPISVKLPAVEKPYSMSKIHSDIATEAGISQGKVKAVLARFQTLIAGHLQHKQPFSLLGLLKIQVVTKPATKARKGINPLTGKPLTIPAKPAHPAVKLKALKKLKAMV